MAMGTELSTHSLNWMITLLMIVVTSIKHLWRVNAKKKINKFVDNLTLIIKNVKMIKTSWPNARVRLHFQVHFGLKKVLGLKYN